MSIERYCGSMALTTRPVSAACCAEGSTPPRPRIAMIVPEYRMGESYTCGHTSGNARRADCCTPGVSSICDLRVG